MICPVIGMISMTHLLEVNLRMVKTLIQGIHTPNQDKAKFYKKKNLIDRLMSFSYENCCLLEWSNPPISRQNF